MGKKKHVQETKETKKTIIIFIILALFLVGMILIQSLSSYRRLEVKRCVTTMACILDAMKVMDREFKFKFNPATQSDKYILDSLALYFLYGKDAFVEGEENALRYKSRDALQQMQQISRTDNFFPLYPECPAAGSYSFIPIKNSDFFNIKCSVHGTLEQPDEKGRYVFDGKISRLSPAQVGLEQEARVVISRPVEIGKDILIVVSKPQPQPLTIDEQTSPTLSRSELE